MPQIGTFTVNDGSATPVAITYGIEKLSTERSVLVDRRMATRDAQPQIVIDFTPATSGRKTYRRKTAHALPIVRTINGVETVIDVARANVEYVLPTSMTQQERKHLQAMVNNTDDHTVVKAGVVDLDPLRG